MSEITLKQCSGYVKWYDMKKGIGFIIPHDQSQDEVFLHPTCLHSFGVHHVTRGDEIEFISFQTTRGIEVTSILKIDGYLWKIQRIKQKQKRKCSFQALFYNCLKHGPGRNIVLSNIYVTNVLFAKKTIT